MILASNSPRRKQILEEAGYDFDVRAHATDESYDFMMARDSIAKYLAIKKNRYHRNLFPNELILTADTTVILNDHLLEKPNDLEEAKLMLEKLSGSEHRVITGVCISRPDKEISFDDNTVVEFRQLSKEEIDFYVHNYQPIDKAGAYGIQEWIGLIGIPRITGSYFNVMGLPIEKIYLILKDSFDVYPTKKGFKIEAL